MQIIIDILAGIGFLTVLGFVRVAFELLKEKRQESKRRKKWAKKRAETQRVIRIQHSEEPGGTCAGKKNSGKLNAWQK